MKELVSCCIAIVAMAMLGNPQDIDVQSSPLLFGGHQGGQDTCNCLEDEDLNIPCKKQNGQPCFTHQYDEMKQAADNEDHCHYNSDEYCKAKSSMCVEASPTRVIERFDDCVDKAPF